MRPNREGCIAATYEVDCAIGLPFSAIFVESRLPNVAPAAPPPAPREDWGNESMSDDEKQNWPEDSESQGLGDDLFTSSDLPPDDSPSPGLFESSDEPGLEPSAASAAAQTGSLDWLDQDTGDVGPNTLPPQLQEAQKLDDLGHTPTGEFDVFTPEDNAEGDEHGDAPEREHRDEDEGEGEGVDLGDFDAPETDDGAGALGSDVPVATGETEPADEPFAAAEGASEDPFAADDAAAESDPFASDDAAPEDDPFAVNSPSGPTTSVEIGGADEDASEPETETDSSDGGSAGLPAHLQLPAIDFSLPTESTTDATVSANRGEVELPAHLNLPSFPQFDLPPVPGEEPEEDRRLSDGTEVAGFEGGGGSFAEFDDTSGVGPAPAAAPEGQAGARDEGWSVGAPSAGPPPMPPPMPAKPKAAPPTAEEPAGLPALPSLPTIQAREEPKRDPTLIDRQVGDELKGGHKGLYIAGGAMVLLLAAVVGAFLYKDVLIETVADPNAGVDESTLKAQQIRIESRKLWADANDLYKKKKLDDAIDKVHESLALDPAFGKSHRLLGVVYAELKRNEEAVQHYRRYLQLEPEAPDAKDVRQIIDDYERSKEKEAAAAKPEDKKSKRRERR